MKAYFLNKEQITALIEYGRSERSNYYVSSGDLVKDVAEDLKVLPIELDEATVAEITSACRYYPKEYIVGFTQKDGELKGVFIKEEAK
jgi:hypothetical protein